MEYLKKHTRRKKKFNLKKYKMFTDFSCVSEKCCIEADKYNIKTYQNSLTEVSNAIKIIERNGLSANINVPLPPSPTNHNKYLLWVKRSATKPVTLQSHATLFLHKRGYVINKDYEAYQAIDIANEIKIREGDDNIFDEKFLHVHNNNFDIKTDNEEHVVPQTFQQQNYSHLHSHSHSYPHPTPSYPLPPISNSYPPPTNAYNNIYPTLPTLDNTPPSAPFFDPFSPPKMKKSKTTLQANDVYSVSNLNLYPHVSERVENIENGEFDISNL